MNRPKNFSLLAMLTVGLLWAGPVLANDNDTDLRTQLDELKQQVSELQANRAASADADIEAYLDNDSSWANESQGGDSMKGVTIRASVLVVNQNTVGVSNQDGGNISAASGLMELMFNFQVTEDLSIFADLYANTNGHLDDSVSFGRATLGSLFDGVGIDSSALVRPRGGVQVREAGFNYRVAMGGMDLNMTVGLIDPRNRYLTSAFSSNFRTGFLNNEFVDASGISWITNGGIADNILGANLMMAFGGEKQFIVQVGWYAGEGRWFDAGQLYLEFHWKAEVGGRPMNVKAMIMFDGYYTPATPGSDDDVNYGISWDWKVTDTIGLWATFSKNSEAVNQVEQSWSIGAVLMGLIGSRPDDEIGVAVGMLTANNDPAALGATPDDAELIIEAYYKYVTANGKMQISPHVQYIADPGAGTTMTDSSLLILGVRIYIPF